MKGEETLQLQKRGDKMVGGYKWSGHSAPVSRLIIHREHQQGRRVNEEEEEAEAGASVAVLPVPAFPGLLWGPGCELWPSHQ